jgi:hypothetical protein
LLPLDAQKKPQLAQMKVVNKDDALYQRVCQ